LLQRFQTPTAGTVIGALLILLGGIVYVSGSASVGTFLSLAGFGLILKYRCAARSPRPTAADAHSLLALWERV
jgi:hypothetical protein